MRKPLYSVNSVLSVVRIILNHGLHGMHRWGAAALIENPKYPLYSVYSVHSVVRRFFNHGLHGLCTAALLHELNGKLVA